MIVDILSIKELFISRRMMNEKITLKGLEIITITLMILKMMYKLLYSNHSI